MTNANEYTPPKIWTWEKPNGGKFAGINQPTAGSRQEKELPIGRHPLQLYSMGTPNGVKVTIMLEELLALGHSGGGCQIFCVNGVRLLLRHSFLKLNTKLI